MIALWPFQQAALAAIDAAHGRWPSPAAVGGAAEEDN